MGYGDAVMTSAIVKRAYAKVGKPLCVGNGAQIFWNEVFENNPKVSRETYPGCLWVHDHKGNRAYIDYSRTDKLHTAYRSEHRTEPGEIFLTDDEKIKWANLTDPFVLVEPNIKGSYGGNKDWGFSNWQKVVEAMPEIIFAQPVANNRTPILNKVIALKTESFRDACALLDRATVFSGTDGGLHHAAAALRKRAVVLWGGLVGPDVLGYVGHRNLCKTKVFCGSHVACPHCKQAMEKITVEEVCDAIRAEYRNTINAYHADTRTTGEISAHAGVG